ncbi:hypothetical protein KDAU_69080 [Dictyobacter aurantiacus]|uniref:Uncharacterized protein n=1 Tax=Dictyobacter aurantiacus TaxID=1936993 RepID=A0A401ZRR5_9CHLR|nr:hypothetical protein KDAU_69080 [Dictyobacter aurantiacus]
MPYRAHEKALAIVKKSAYNACQEVENCFSRIVSIPFEKQVFFIIENRPGEKKIPADVEASYDRSQ